MNKHIHTSTKILFSLLFYALISTFSIQGITAQQTKTGDFATGKNEFLLNGKPFIIRAGELHYSRIPKPYWEHRIQLCKAMGMNTICIYLFWNYHEMEKDHFDFTGQKDVMEFIRLIQKNGMYCILRPGPYACAEWDMGGLPWWLLKKEDLKVRTRNDDYFMERTKHYLNEAGKRLAPLQIQNGGPIIMVQVENEYGVWGKDQTYMEQIRDNIRAAGFDKVQLFRCDWSSNFDKYKLPGVASALNFGAGSNIDGQFSKFKELNPDAPLMCSEYWTGWFDQWGRPHETRSVNTFIGSLKDMMDRKISFSLYMAHGGTSFGQWAGANAPAYAPTTSSYDYNAPIDEAGNTTDKFFAVRDLLKNYLNEGEKLGEIPASPTKTITVPMIKFKLSANLFDNLPKAKLNEKIRPMEFFDQGWGSILYRTKITPSAEKRTLTLTDLHDWATIFVDGKLIGKLDRRRGDKTVELPAIAKTARLDILVEGMGRVNYGEAILDRKGITKSVTIAENGKESELNGWEVYNFPVDYKSQLRPTYKQAKANGPAWYKATFNLKETGYTYFDMSTWGKGMVWINGYNLGRFWKIGPTQTLCVPACYLKKGLNEIIVFDIDQPRTTTIEGLDHAILDKTSQDESLLHRKAGEQLNLTGAQPIQTGSLSAESGWKAITFAAPTAGRYFCFEALSAQQENDKSTSIAEFEIIGTDDKPISTLNWRVLYADSEEVTKANNAADKIYDLQESIIWQTQSGDKSSKHPHQVVIDMGASYKVKGFRILPRSDKSKAGIVKDYRFFLQDKPFKF